MRAIESVSFRGTAALVVEVASGLGGQLRQCSPRFWVRLGAPVVRWVPVGSSGLQPVAQMRVRAWSSGGEGAAFPCPLAVT